ncbi:UDP-4-amino-4,6-dideoxy-N-acetyl-beta-L-altrosamine transaminase [Ferrovibrio sp.]|uniref:UDP-4-amino-4, 6-dideoxy-N-acetyl-beta-L-altrosamine transaminase n=1 Tax=Ferrovibrio sp. TaxID=1917215 RepID=UPI0025C53829|nr:UDP-4-amino-4,6-dideoxy-N-acetyl-beta-L-altrosamine transaminase [Ferrovibrio sp.]MBX3456296.1 UDP-4-amino-4,6-dideoxy-N-acetyl-beta-L-altrosamine transaminase [Ferrovibrio sp.]
MTKLLPYGRHSVDEEDIALVTQILRGDFLTTGPTINAFEAALSAKLDGAYVVLCSNGTAALHMMSLALPLQPGDVLVVPAITFLATANAARYVGAEVEFADVDQKTGLMTPETLSAAITSARRRFGKTPRAATVVHMAGQSGDIPGLAAKAAENGMILMEDAAHAVGGRYLSQDTWMPIGAAHHAALCAFSFHPVKTMTMGEGGAVSTRDKALADRLLLARNHGMQRDPTLWRANGDGFEPDGTPRPWYYEMQEPGFNYRATDIQAALGMSQLSKLDLFVTRRAAIVERYQAGLANLSPLLEPLRMRLDSRPGWHLFVVLLDFEKLGMSRTALMKRLQAAGIGSQVHYIPLYRQPYFLNRYGEMRLPGAELYYERALSLPLYPAMTDTDVDHVIETVSRIVKEG